MFEIRLDHCRTMLGIYNNTGICNDRGIKYAFQFSVHEGGREGRKEGEGGREGGREGGTDGRTEGGREGGRDGGNQSKAG